MIEIDQDNKQYDEIFVSELPSEMLSCWNGKVHNQTLHFSTELQVNSISADSQGNYIFKSSPLFPEQTKDNSQFCVAYSREVIGESPKSFVEAFILQQSEEYNLSPSQPTSRSEENKLDESTHQIKMDHLENSSSILLNRKGRQNVTIPLKYTPSCIELCELGLSKEERPREQVTLLFTADCSEVHAYEVISSDSGESDHSDSIRLKECTRTLNNVESENTDEKNEFINHLFRTSNEMMGDAFMCRSSIISMRSYSFRESVDCPLHLLAMSCEDGSIRIIFYVAYREEVCPDEWNTRLDIIKVSELAVDGPITSLSFTVDHERRNIVKLLIGSIWGFCCFFDLNECDCTFSGPHNIANGFWNSKYSEEDAVTSLHHLGISNGFNKVLIGLFSGRVILLSSNTLTEDSMNTKQSDVPLSSNCIFHTLLPYPILAIQSLKPYDAIIPDIIVITRRTIHVFRSSVEKIVNDTKERIENVMRQYV
jgi:hypothetical protein